MKLLLVILFSSLVLSQTIDPNYLGKKREAFEQLKFKAHISSPMLWAFTTWNDTLLRGPGRSYWDEIRLNFRRIDDDTICTSVEYIAFICDSVAFEDSIGNIYYDAADSTTELKTLEMFETLIQVYEPSFVMDKTPPEVYRRYEVDLTRDGLVYAKARVLWNRGYYEKYEYWRFSSYISLSFTFTNISNDVQLSIPEKIRPAMIYR